MGYKVLRRAQNAWRTVRYRANRLTSPTYRVRVGSASARFAIPTRQEFLDYSQLDERPILEDLIGELRPDDVFYDVGANIGLYSCLAADEVEADVYAFEPHPVNADRLEENASLNDASIRTYEWALADADGTGKLVLSPGFPLERLGSAGHTLVTEYHDEMETDTERIEITKRRGDDVVETEGLPAPSVLKIDVEGAEMDVLEGLESTLAESDCRLVYCEIHPARLRSQGHSVSSLRALFERHGFSVEEMSIPDGQAFLRAKKAD